MYFRKSFEVGKKRVIVSSLKLLGLCTICNKHSIGLRSVKAGSKINIVKTKRSDYKHQEVEAKWQEKWVDEKVYSPDLQKAKDPYYSLMMFPYPSAEGLHVGNVYAFTGSDIWGRYQRMQGKDVFEPIGLDGFGIHSENYAIKIGTHPVEQSQKAEVRFYKQLQSIGNGFAWDNRVETYSKNYYRWTQWLFVQMFKHGLAYRQKAAVNWCPSCKTVLADEQVIADKCERCSNVVEQRDLEQWFFRITDYADRLLENLEKIDWVDKVKTAQHGWIGKSEGAEVKFSLVEVEGQEDGKHSVTVFTTRPDTLFGATFLVISPELADSWVNIGWKAEDVVNNYIKDALLRRKSEENTTEKTGVFAGIYAINPVNEKKIPVWVSDYVLAGYGTGAIMAVPAHDDRDLEFAKKFNLEVIPVIEPITGEVRENEENRKSIVAILKQDDRVLSINWGKKLGGNLFVGGGLEEGEDVIECAKREIEEETGYKNIKFVAKTQTVHHHYFAASKGVNRNIEAVGLLFELENEEKSEVKLEENEKDKFTVEWLGVNEARDKVKDELHKFVFESLVEGKAYTGKGILTNSGEWNGLVVPESMSKVLESLEKTGKGEPKANYHLRDWLISRQRYWGPPIPMIYCQSCESAAKGERKDMPGWYCVPEEELPVELPYVENFKPTGTGESPLGQDKEWVKAKCPGCGGEAKRETDVSDTFLDSAWYFLRYPSVGVDDQPFDAQITKKWLPVNMYIGGAEHSVLHLMYSRFVCMALKDWGLIDFEEPFTRFYAHGLIIKDGAKMSKSKGNVVVPDEYIQKYGADTLRTYLMFLGPYEAGGDFRDSGIEGMSRFIKRVHTLITEHFDADFKAERAKDMSSLTHKTIKRVTADLNDLRYNRAIAGIMEYVNGLTDMVGEWKEGDDSFVKIPEWKESIKTLLLLLAPFAPHMTEELWQQYFGEEKYVSIHKQNWPKYDDAKTIESSVNIPVQVNGKMRGTILMEVSEAENQETVETEAKKLDSVARQLEGKSIQKVIYVKGRLINFVVS